MVARSPIDRAALLPWRRFAGFQALVWAFLSVIVILPALGFPGHGASNAVPWVVAWATSGLVVSTALAAIYLRVPERWLRGVTLAGVIVGMSFVGSLSWALLVRGAEAVVGREPWIPPGADPDIHVLILTTRGALVLGLWTALFLVTLFSARVQQARERSARAEALAAEARLELLRGQLNPHFLFNALNSIVALIEESPRAAQAMVRDVSALLRRSLDADRRRTSTVEAELEFVRLYVRCEQVRFEERLRVAFDVDAALASRPVPPMLLHPLVENAIKHGMAQAEGTLDVAIAVKRVGDRIVLEVSNGGSLARAPGALIPQGTGVGLSNVEQRLEHLFPGRHAFSLEARDGRVVARIELPIEGSDPNERSAPIAPAEER